MKIYDIPDFIKHFMRQIKEDNITFCLNSFPTLSEEEEKLIQFSLINEGKIILVNKDVNSLIENNQEEIGLPVFAPLF